MHPVLLIYLAGVAVGFWRTDGRPLTRAGLALVWPLGPLAFVATVALLLGAAMIAFPALGLLALAAAVIWWILA